MRIDDKTKTSGNFKLTNGEILTVGFPDGNNKTAKVFLDSQFSYLVNKEGENIIRRSYDSKTLKILGAIVDSESIGEGEIITPKDPRYAKYKEFLN